MAHVRRPFYDLYEAHKSAVAKEALERIAALYVIEDEIRGRSAEERREVRNARSRPLLESLKQWFEETLGKLSRKSDTTKAIRYALGRWEAVMRFCDDGHLEIDNNAANTASGIGGVMPRAGLCRVRAGSESVLGGSLVFRARDIGITTGSPRMQAMDR